MTLRGLPARDAAAMSLLPGSKLLDIPGRSIARALRDRHHQRERDAQHDTMKTVHPAADDAASFLSYSIIIIVF